MAVRKVKHTMSMSKNQESKVAVVANIKEKFEKAQSVVLINYQGINVEQDTALRNQFRQSGVEYAVLKNTLVRRAVNEMGITGLDSQLEGPSAFAFGMSDPVSPAKVIYDFIGKNKLECLSVKAGLMGTEVMDVQAVKALSELPSREVLLARLVGTLNASVANLVYVLEAIRKKQSGEA